MNLVDKARVRLAFSRGARQYDALTPVQQYVTRRVALLAEQQVSSPDRVLDVGSGTGTLLRLLSERLSPRRAVGLDLSHAMSCTARARTSRPEFVTGDAEALPFGDGTFDLVVSTSTFQWLTRLHEATAEVRRVLAPGGVFCLALFCDRTLYELRHAWRDALAERGLAQRDRTHRFASPTDIEEALASAGLVTNHLSTEERVSHHPNVKAILESLRTIGAGNAAPSTTMGLSGRQVMLDMMRIYTERYGSSQSVPATYEIGYAVARREGGRCTAERSLTAATAQRLHL